MQQAWNAKEAGQAKECARLLRLGLEQAENCADPGAALVPTLATCGIFFQEIRDYSQAERYYQQCLSLLEQDFPEPEPRRLQCLNGLIDIYCAQGRKLESVPLMVRWIETAEKIEGPENPAVVSVIARVGDLLSEAGRDGEAEPFYKRAVELEKMLYGSESPERCTTLNNLAALYGRNGEYFLARDLYEQALALLERAYGAGHKTALTIRNNIASLEKLKESARKSSESTPRHLQLTPDEREAEERDRKLMAGVRRINEQSGVSQTPGSNNIPSARQLSELEYWSTLGNAGKVKLAILGGADINYRGQTGATALHLAVERGHIEVVRLLIASGADASVLNIQGETPLDLAAKSGNEKMISALTGT